MATSKLTPHVYSIKLNYLLGHTLLELLISVALFGILLVGAAPSLGAAIERSKLRTSSLGVLESLALARATAISQSKTVFVCRLNPNQQCVVSNTRNHAWNQGWQIFVDENNNNKFDVRDSLLFTGRTDPSISVVFNQNGQLRFFPNGSARSAGFYLCGPKLGDTTHLKLLHTGRVRLVNKASKKAHDVCKKTF